MKDCIGQEIKVGSTVLHSGSGADFYKATVLSFTPKQVKIQYGITQYQIERNFKGHIACVYPNYIVVVDDNFARMEWDAKQLKRKQA